MVVQHIYIASINFPRLLEYRDKFTQMDLWAACGFRAISFIFRLSIVCGSVALATLELSLGWPTQYSNDKHGLHHRGEVVFAEMF